MNPGLELDALVAEKVMGFQHDPDCTLSDHTTCHEWTWGGVAMRNAEDIPAYSTDIAAAWEVVARLSEEPARGLAPAIYPPNSAVEPGRFNGEQWMIRFYQSPNEDSPYDWDTPITVFADTAPHAICLTALKAVNAL